MGRFVRVGGSVVLVVVAAVGAFAYWARTAARPKNLGVNNGQLAPCPSTPNCVTTQQGLASQLMPALTFTGDPAAAKARLLRIINGLERTTVIVDEPTYLATEFRSKLFQFIDDVEFVIDPASQQIHFRSASRLGRGDMNANRNRMSEISRAWNSGT